MPRPNVPLGIQANPGRDPRSPIGETGEIDLLGIIGRMLAGEDDPNAQQMIPGNFSAFSPPQDDDVSDYPLDDAAQTAALEAQGQQFATNAAETAALARNIPTIQANPDPARVRPEGYAADQASINDLGGTEGWTAGQWPPYGTFGDYRMGLGAAMKGGPHWPTVENPTGGFISPPGRPSPSNEPIQSELGARPAVTSEVLQAPTQSNRELEQALFDIIMRSGNV